MTRTKTIAVSDLDAYRWYLNSHQPFRDFAGRLLRRDKPGIAARIGTDLHTAIHRVASEPGEIPSTIWRGNRVVKEFKLPEKPTTDVLPINGAQFEWRCRYDLARTDDTLRLSGYIDALTADRRIWEFKTTRRANGWVERYQDAMQWRAYALCRDHMLGLSPDESERYASVHYVVFFLKYDEVDVLNGAPVEVSDIAELELRPYPSMESDVVDAMHDFARFIDLNLPAYWRRHEAAVREAPLDELIRAAAA